MTNRVIMLTAPVWLHSFVSDCVPGISSHLICKLLWWNMNWGHNNGVIDCSQPTHQWWVFRLVKRTLSQLQGSRISHSGCFFLKPFLLIQCFPFHSFLSSPHHLICWHFLFATALNYHSHFSCVRLSAAISHLSYLSICLSFVWLLSLALLSIVFPFAPLPLSLLHSIGGSIPIVFSYYSEFLAQEKRGEHLSWLCMFWMIGGIYASAMAWAIIPHYGEKNKQITQKSVSEAICTPGC